MAAGRDESDFYEALGIVGEGPLISYTAAHYEDLNGNPVAMGSTGAVFVGIYVIRRLRRGKGTDKEA